MVMHQEEIQPQVQDSKMKTVFQLQRNEILQLKISDLFILSKITGTCSFIHKKPSI
jgi:hypothetical protein